MDSFPRFTRSEAFKELLVQDLEGKQLPVIDVIPYATITPQQTEPAKPKTVTRANSTKVKLFIGIIAFSEYFEKDDYCNIPQNITFLFFVCTGATLVSFWS